jgi:hypothetical protein
MRSSNKTKRYFHKYFDENKNEWVHLRSPTSCIKKERQRINKFLSEHTDSIGWTIPGINHD